MGNKELKSAYELASLRIIKSKYAEEFQKQAEKKRQQDLERINNSPDFIAQWERMLLDDPKLEQEQDNDLVEKRATVYHHKEDRNNYEELTEQETNKYGVEIMDPETISVNKHPHLYWYGHFTSYSGFSRMNRAMLFELANRAIDIKPDIQKSTIEVSETTVNELKRMEKIRLRPDAPKVFGATVPISMYHAGKKILYTMMETSETLHKDYIEKLNLFDEIWVPTNYGKNQFLKNKIRPPIYVMPLGVDAERYKKNNTSYNFGIDRNSFTFLSVFKWGYRKGFDILLRAYLEEFDSKDDVTLLMVSRNEVDPDKERIYKDFEFIRGGVDKSDDALPHVSLYDKIIPEKDMPKVYNSCQSFVLMSRGEGFSLGVVEAASCGLPVIATNCTAHTDFLTNDNSFLVEPEGFVKVSTNGHLRRLACHCGFYEDQLFPNFGPDAIKQTRKHMRYVYENREEATLKGEKLTNLIRSEYTWTKAADKVYKRVLELQ
jgi:glycosyltransferase involved in cell wall biosynthesis